MYSCVHHLSPDVMSLAKFVTFRLPGSQAWDDAEENIDGIQYRTNFFKACLGLTDNVEIRKEILKRTFDTFDTSEICQDMYVFKVSSTVQDERCPMPVSNFIKQDYRSSFEISI